MVEAQLGIHPFQALVLGFQLTQPLDVRAFHPAVLGFPVVVGRFTDPVLATDVRCFHPGICLLENLHDLVFRKARFLHLEFSSFVLVYWKTPLFFATDSGDGYRGTMEAVDKLEQLKKQIPEGAVKNINWLIEQARARYQYGSWIPPTPQTILQLAADRKRRQPRNADQLLDLVMEALDGIQRDFRGDAAKKYAVWDWQANSKNYRPTNREENFADVLRSWLQTRLDFVIVNREPRITILPQSAERTDIQIETWSDGDEPLMVIVEVKCCWYRQLYTQMQDQLVDTYLAKHTYCSHGIYLVGYFASPEWDPDDLRCDKCNRRDKAEILQKLGSEAVSLQCEKPIVVKPYLFDASM